MINIYRLPKKKFASLKIFIKRTRSNLFFSVAGFKNHVFKVFSTGSIGFRNTKKDTPYAAETLGKTVGRYILKNHNNRIAVVFKSPVDGRVRAAMRGLASFGSLFFIVSVKSQFSPAHNGCRSRKLRRV